MIDGFRYYRTGTVSHSSFPIANEVQLMRVLTKRIEEVIKIEKPDVLHAHSPILNGIPALWAGHKLGIPVVYEIRAFWEDAAVDHGTYSQNSWKYKLVNTLEKWVCLKAKSVAVLCDGLKEDLIDRGIPFGKITVVPNAVSPDDFKHSEPDEEFIRKWNLGDKKVIGFIGSFYRYEGLDLLIDAFNRLGATRQDIALLLVGGGEMEAELKKQIERLHLKDKVIMPGRISHERIPAIYALVDVLVYPRYSMRLTELVTPLKPLEAMAMGKALVASDVRGHRELIRQNVTGLLFPAGDASALGETVKNILDDNILSQKLAEHALIWAQDHTWDKAVLNYSILYRDFGKKSV
jgi:PEP-CTERM/exosortase A-associated glycosyltransferase